MLETCIFDRTVCGVTEITENRRIKINYPGSGNNSQFSYDGLGHVVKIVETVSGTVTSTKQFVQTGIKMREIRDSSGNVLSQFFKHGQTIGGTNYFYTRDHLNSVRELTDTSGNGQATYSYSPFGNVIKLQNAVAPDFQYAGYYAHVPSGLNVTLFRSYSSSLGRWIRRDPIGERYGANLYAYVRNEPMNLRDPFGLMGMPPMPVPPKPLPPNPVPTNCPIPNSDDPLNACRRRCQGLQGEMHKQCMFVCLGQNLPGWGDCADHCEGWGDRWTAPWIECMYICLGGDEGDEEGGG